MEKARRPATRADKRQSRAGRAELRERLNARLAEIERAALSRAYGVSDPRETADPEYLDGLRAAVSAAIEYGLTAIEEGERNPPAIPAVLLVQARVAARNGVGLDTVLRRYFAGYTLVGDFVLEEAQEGDLLHGAALKRLLRAQATVFDRLLAAVSEEHARESEARRDTTKEHRRELVERLLAGERLDPSELAYDLEAVHLGLVAKGPGAEVAGRELAAALDRRLLSICPGGQTVWAWLEGRRPFDHVELGRLLPSTIPPGVVLALGEPGEGVSGWRLTHLQARAALPIAQRGSEPFVRYADVALLASMLQDDLLATSLRQLYLAPLQGERDGGEALRQTLRAYLTAGRSVSSAAAALGVKRHTVTNRLRAIEERLERPLDSCVAEIDAALRLEDLGRTHFHRGVPSCA